MSHITCKCVKSLIHSVSYKRSPAWSFNTLSVLDFNLTSGHYHLLSCSLFLSLSLSFTYSISINNSIWKPSLLLSASYIFQHLLSSLLSHPPSSCSSCSLCGIHRSRWVNHRDAECEITRQWGILAVADASPKAEWKGWSKPAPAQLFTWCAMMGSWIPMKTLGVLDLFKGKLWNVEMTFWSRFPQTLPVYHWSSNR